MVNNEPLSLPREAYQTELKYLEAMAEHDKVFSELIGRIPPEENTISEELGRLRSTKPNWLLDPEKLSKLKESNAGLYTKICNYYFPFLAEKAGIKK